jgi:caffeoyl-CoA O-methyltransferase
MRRMNEIVVHDKRVESVMLPMRDGVTLARKL